jgi:integrase
LKGRSELVFRWKDPITRRWCQQSAGTANRRKAEKAAARLEVTLATPIADEDCTFEQFEARYKDEWVAALAEGTRVTVNSAFKQVKKHLNPRRLTDVTKAHVMLLQTKMREDGLSPNTIQGYLGHIRSAFSWAVEVGLIPEVPWPVKKRRQAARKSQVSRSSRGRAPTTEEFERMLGAISQVPRVKDRDGLRFCMRGLWLSGLRLEESGNLTWDDSGELAIDLSGDHPRMRIWGEGQKSGMDQYLPITPDFAEFLLAVPEADRVGQVFRVESAYAGRYLDHKTVGDLIRAIGRKANVLVNRQTEKFATAHDLRRAFGTRWAARVMPTVLKDLMRHKSIETTMKYYVTHQADEVSRKLHDDWGTEAAEATPGSNEGDKTGDTKTAPNPARRRGKSQ